MKLKGIWIAICLILVAGLCATSYTKQYTSETVAMRSLEAAAVPETAAAPHGGERSDAAAYEASKIPQAAAARERAGAGDQAAADGRMAADSQTGADGRMAAGDQAVSKGRTGSGDQAVSKERTATEGQAAAYGQTAADDQAANSGAKAEIAQAEETLVSPVMEELFDLDDQIERSHTKTVDTTANSMKATAESEWKLWEAKMERYLDVLEEKLSDQDRAALFTEQKEWNRERESAAAAASKKQSSSALIELEYNLSMKEITRERVYELARRYEKELTEG